jgi:hypothetical protein
MNIPDKCLTCNHTIIAPENVHKGWCKFQLESVVRCDRFPARYIDGSVAANVYCNKRKEVNV